ncbi:hypothetical protein [Krasilnikovia sp. M28-CT-15]|uniref:hypothetical protein n=1 Tax=Krasilnikovia sp. M28-CT-15 TaxID=3373540 RepID=UPI003875D48C
MSNIEVIVAALAAGASAGVTNTATAAVQDAYAGLKKVLRPWVRGDGRAALEADETDEGVWQARLGEELTASGAAEDAQVRAAAELLLGLADPAKAATYNITVGTNSGVVGGTFTAPVTINQEVSVPPVPPATA